MSEEVNAQGWDCITETFDKIYPNQNNPLHFGTLISWQFGGNDPLEGISVYDGGDFWHFVTYGFSELYEKESENKEYSGYGFELTAKLKKNPDIDDSELKCMAGVLQSLGRYVFNSGSVLQPYEYIYTGQESGMDAKGKSKITGFITVLDETGEIDTPNGKLEFVQLIGMTDNELKMLVDKKITVKELVDRLGHTLTDYCREEITLS